jgi:hypothetical protein
MSVSKILTEMREEKKEKTLRAVGGRREGKSGKSKERGEGEYEPRRSLLQRRGELPVARAQAKPAAAGLSPL